MGGKFFRNHINFHHTYYSKDHLVSRTYLGDEGNNTPFFFIPVFFVGARTYLLLPHRPGERLRGDGSGPLMTRPWGGHQEMLLLMRVLIALVIATLFAWPALIGLRTGQINVREWIIKRRCRPLIFWTIVAFNLFFAVAFIAIGLEILVGLF
jgi:hypothetical protein